MAQHDRLLVAGVPVAPGGLDQVVGAVGADPPDDVLTVPILRNRDVERVDSLPVHARRQPGPLRWTHAAAGRAAVIGDRHLLDHLPVRTDQDGPQLGVPVLFVEVSLLHVDDQLAWGRQEVRSADPADAQFDAILLVHGQTLLFR